MFNPFRKTKKEDEKKHDDLMSLGVPDFAHAHKDLLVIVCDPKTDNIFVGYNDIVVSGRIKSAVGKRMHVVRDVLRYSQFNSGVDLLIAQIAETLKLSLKHGRLFYQFLDGALFNIARTWKHKKERREGAIESPFVKGGKVEV